ncbi:MAG: LysM peptidoglycan-binding domain-containing protein [Oscillospiraceae bacterium]|nr:LysM peptidoglycan-binding domain-containing protein [Oscillospiraceae bacterium]
MKVKKIKLVNPKKFVVSISIIIGIIICALFFINTISFSHSETTYKSITVISGDTLWSIASSEQQYNSYYANKDIRYIIEDIKDKNDLSNSSLYINEVLQIPTYL